MSCRAAQRAQTNSLAAMFPELTRDYVYASNPDFHGTVGALKISSVTKSFEQVATGPAGHEDDSYGGETVWIADDNGTPKLARQTKWFSVPGFQQKENEKVYLCTKACIDVFDRYSLVFPYEAVGTVPGDESKPESEQRVYFTAPTGIAETIPSIVDSFITQYISAGFSFSEKEGCQRLEELVHSALLDEKEGLSGSRIRARMHLMFAEKFVTSAEHFHPAPGATATGWPLGRPVKTAERLQKELDHITSHKPLGFNV